jgi:endonuclease/exonuclease/phosphatase family metal-dependent hydrolase
VNAVHEGLAIFSRFPISEVSKTKLSQNAADPDDFHQRIALRAGFHWRDADHQPRTVHVITTHL